MAKQEEISGSRRLDWKKALPWGILIFVIVFVLISITNISSSNSGKSLNVQGSYTSKAESNELTMYLGIETQANSAKDAEEQNKVIAEALYSSLKALGLDSSEYKTDSYSVYPNRDWNNYNLIRGHTVSHTVRIQTDRIDLAGEIIDSASTAGANNIYGVSFGLDDETRQKTQEEALKKATENAKGKAEAIASGLGKRLGSVISVSDSTVNYYPFVTRDYAESMPGSGSDADSSQIVTEPGTVEVTASVAITYSIR